MLLCAVSLSRIGARDPRCLWIALAAPARAWPQALPRGVLLINSYNLGYEWTDELTRGVRAGLDGHGTPIDLSVEFLDARRRGEELFPQMRALLAARYSPEKTSVDRRRRRPDAEVPARRARTCSPDVPGRLLRRQQRRARGAGATRAGSPACARSWPSGRSSTSPSRCTSPRRFFVVSDDTLTSTTHRRNGRGLRPRAARAASRSTWTAGSCRSSRCWRRCGRETTSRDLLLTTPFTRDHTGQSFTARESLARITAASAAPTYTPMSIEGGPGTGGERRQRRLRARPDDGATRHGRPARASTGGSAASRRSAGSPTSSTTGSWPAAASTNRGCRRPP